MSAPSALDRVRLVAQQDKDARFTALLHHVSLDRLRAAYGALSPKAAAGVDGVMWLTYGEDLEANPPGPAPEGSAGSVPSKAVSSQLHPEGGRAAAAARHRRAGGQGRPAGGRRGSERCLRAGLPRLLLRTPSRAQPARCAGCARGRDPEEEGELGARCGHPRLLHPP
jgi:hypothetical protein